VTTRKCYLEALKASSTQNVPVLNAISMLYNFKIIPTPTRKNSMTVQPIVIKEIFGSPNLLVESIILPKDHHARVARKLNFLLTKSNTMTAATVAIVESKSAVDLNIIETAALFVPKPILQAVYSESLAHIGELRVVSTMFLSLDSYSPSLHVDPRTLQPFFRKAQQILHEAGGFLRQFLVDDKGCVFIAMWGTPSFTYENNCSRALYCAVAINKSIGEIGHACSVGVTNWQCFLRHCRRTEKARLRVYWNRCEQRGEIDVESTRKSTNRLQYLSKLKCEY
jgi:hypothetical protein